MLRSAGSRSATLSTQVFWSLPARIPAPGHRRSLSAKRIFDVFRPTNSSFPHMHTDPLPRTVRESRSEFSEICLPNETNMLGTMLGGHVMHLVDVCGAIAAVRHARCAVVTASVDQMTFLHPVHIGELVCLKSQVNRVFRTSMEVGVKVWVENLLTGEIRHTSSAYLTFVAVDSGGRAGGAITDYT